MNKRMRSAIFWSFTSFFFISAPLIVLYTAGFRYNPMNGSFVRTGSVSITSSPRNAEIFVNGEPVGKTTPFVIKRALPGTYNFTLKRAGYHPWTGTDLEVKSGGTTPIQQAFLLLNEDASELFSAPVRALAPNPNGELIIYTTTNADWTELWSFDSTSSTTTLLDSIATTSPSIELAWSEDGSYASLFAPHEAILRLYARDGSSLALQQELPNTIERTFWHPNESILYGSTTTQLVAIEPVTNTVTTTSNSDAVSVLIDRSVLTFFDNGSQIELRQSTDQGQKLVALLPRGKYMVEEQDGSHVIVQDTRNRIFVLDISASTPILLETRATLFDWSHERDELVFSDGNEITVYSPRSHTFELLTRQSDPIKQIAWHPSGEIVLSSTATKLEAIYRYKQSDKRQIVQLADWTNISDFWLSDDGKHVYLFGNKTGISGVFQLPLRR